MHVLFCSLVFFVKNAGYFDVIRYRIIIISCLRCFEPHDVFVVHDPVNLAFCGALQ